jgi:hypothetical protein
MLNFFSVRTIKDHHHHQTNSATVTNTQFFDELISKVSTVMPHNKLRPPKLCANAVNCDDNLAYDTRSELSYASYNAYISKYRHAFHVCARAGVPQYTTLKLGGMKSHRVCNVGQSFLFVASLCLHVVLPDRTLHRRVEGDQTQRRTCGSSV